MFNSNRKYINQFDLKTFLKSNSERISIWQTKLSSKKCHIFHPENDLALKY